MELVTFTDAIVELKPQSARAQKLQKQINSLGVWNALDECKDATVLGEIVVEFLSSMTKETFNENEIEFLKSVKNNFNLGHDSN